MLLYCLSNCSVFFSPFFFSHFIFSFFLFFISSPLYYMQVLISLLSSHFCAFSFITFCFMTIIIICLFYVFFFVSKPVYLTFPFYLLDLPLYIFCFCSFFVCSNFLYFFIILVYRNCLIPVCFIFI